MITNYKKGYSMLGLSHNLISKSAVLCTLLLTGIYTSSFAQNTTYVRPSWWFGAAAGANVNFYRGSTQQLNSDFTAPVPFHNGNGVGLYLAPLVEYYSPYTKLGFMFQAGYDSRKSAFNEVTTPCNCPADLSVKLSYLTIEPSIRFAPFNSDFYLFGGPRFGFNLSKSFVYQQGTNPDYPAQVENPAVKGDLSHVKQTIISMQIGAGYDIPLSSPYRQTQFMLSPFIAYQPYFGQSPRSIETWTVSTLRVGAAIKFGRSKYYEPETDPLPGDSQVKFSVYAPANIPVMRKVHETFPLRNYVFFDLGSTEIPDRYVLLRKNQVADFKEDKLEMFKPKKLPSRSEKQMIVYYNILNIVGDRMGKNPAATITLVGSSELGENDARVMAESVKTYLVDVFGIEPSRITTEGRDKPKIPSERQGGVLELDLLREGDRRVSIESTSPAMLMEFQNHPNAPLKPVEIEAILEAPPESYVTFNTTRAEEPFTTWSMEIKDEKGEIQFFGPYVEEKVSIPGKFILGDKPKGDYHITMIGQTKAGKVIKKDTTVHMVLWTPPQNEVVTRFSILYEFNESKAIAMYEKYLSEVVIPKIPQGGTVIIMGYTDVIGDAAHNKALSQARANDVKRIMEDALQRVGRSDVKFDVYGFGEDENLTPFENKFPEERFYNRSVVIDIVPVR